MPGGCYRRPRRLLKFEPSAAPLTRGSVDSVFMPGVSGYAGTVRDRNQFVIFGKQVYRFYNGPITTR
jgi:hypothetical protein